MNQQTIRPLEGLYILIVEDAGMTAVNIVRILQERGGAVTEIVSSLSEAQRRLESARYDLVLLDHGLGAKERGTDLALWLKHHTREDLKRIIRVSYSGAEDDIILDGVPADDTSSLFAAMYTKPVPLRELMSFLHDLAVRHDKLRS
jgi:CheY-like chemotaxis protein